MKSQGCRLFFLIGKTAPTPQRWPQSMLVNLMNKQLPSGKASA